MTSSNTHYIPPATRLDRLGNSAVRWLADHGINLAGAQTLTVIGRTSGQPQRIVVNPLTRPDGEFLVAARGQTHWVRNARVNPEAQLRRGRRHRAVRLTELPTADRAPIIRAYLDKWGWEVGRFLPAGLTVDADEATIAAHAADIPVFVVRASDGPDARR